MLLFESKYKIQETRKFRQSFSQLPDHFTRKYLDDAIKLLKSGKKMNWEYKRHPLHGKKEGLECIHIPDPAAYTLTSRGEMNQFSDWMLVFKITNKTILLIETGTYKQVCEYSDE